MLSTTKLSIAMKAIYLYRPPQFGRTFISSPVAARHSFDCAQDRHLPTGEGTIVMTIRRTGFNILDFAVYGGRLSTYSWGK